jgi:hypothetical protein
MCSTFPWMKFVRRAPNLRAAALDARTSESRRSTPVNTAVVVSAPTIDSLPMPELASNTRLRSPPVSICSARVATARGVASRHTPEIRPAPAASRSKSSSATTSPARSTTASARAVRTRRRFRSVRYPLSGRVFMRRLNVQSWRHWGCSHPSSQPHVGDRWHAKTAMRADAACAFSTSWSEAIFLQGRLCRSPGRKAPPLERTGRHCPPMVPAADVRSRRISARPALPIRHT